MAEVREHHDEEEVRRALARIRPPDALRLMQLARNWVRRAPRRDAKDLLNEAFDRLLARRRMWPVDVPLTAFLNGVMRSIVSEWVHDDARQVLAADHEEGSDGSGPPPFNLELSDMLDRMLEHLLNDPPARGVFIHMRAGTKRADAMAALGMDAREYDTARRRMVRTLLKGFGPEWMEAEDERD